MKSYPSLWISYYVTFSDLFVITVVPLFRGMCGLTSMPCSTPQCRDVCVRVCYFVLCHSDDVALAGRRTGASVQASPSMLNVPGHSKLLRTSGSQGLLGSGISRWEETAEACVASALANQHSHRTHMHARRPNLCSPSIIPSSFFFFFFFFYLPCSLSPTAPRPPKSEGGVGGGGN